MNTREILASENGIFNLLLIKLYTGELKPGEKLPSLKAFAKELAVEQASLRLALKQLEMMKLIDIRRSDGFYIQDFRQNGGLDFLTSLFSIQGIQENQTILDSFLIDEILAFWTAIYPEVMFMASQRFSSLDLKRFLEILNTQIDHVDDVDKLVALDLQAQDLVGTLANNLMVSLFFNSVSPMLFKVTDALYRNLTPESRVRFLRSKREGVCRLINGTLDMRVSTEKFRRELEKCREEIRQSFARDMLDIQT